MNITVKSTPQKIVNPYDNEIKSIVNDVQVAIDINIEELIFFHDNYPDTLDAVLSILKEQK